MRCVSLAILSFLIPAQWQVLGGRSCTIAGVPFVLDLGARLFSVELLVENFFKLDHFGEWVCVEWVV